MALEILLVADDLTGALDSAVAFAASGRLVRVVRRPESIDDALRADPEVLAVNTASREGSAVAATDRVVEVADRLAGRRAKLVIKKVDSRLKGHVRDETAALRTALGARQVLACPAIPAMGRIVRGGKLTGFGIAGEIDVGTVFGADVRVADAVSDQALDALLRDLPPGTMLAGARGLAMAVARSLGPGKRQAAPVPALRAPLVLAVGSRDPVTLAQVAALAGKAPVAILGAPDGALDGATAARHVRHHPIAMLRMTEGPGAVPPSMAGARFAQGVAFAVRQSCPATLFACGGETADAILEQLGIDVLDVVAEVAPGVPICEVEFAGRSLAVVTKSGGFGQPQLLAQLIADVEGAAAGGPTTRIAR